MSFIGIALAWLVLLLAVPAGAQAGQTYYIGAGCNEFVYCYVPQSFLVRPG